jgi:hypothetical protein
MTHLRATPRHVAALLLPFLAATLACSGATPGTALTPAATVPGAATAANATLAASGAGTHTPALGGTVVDPCSLMTTDEATALAGETATPPKPLASGCIFFDATITSTGVGLYAFPASQAQGFLGQYVPALESNGVSLDRTAALNLSKDSAAGDMPAAVNDLLILTTGIPGYEVKKLEGVGSAALWSWHTLDQNQEGVLMAAKPGALVVLILHGTATTQEADAQTAMAKIVSRILDKLPDSFTVISGP